MTEQAERLYAACLLPQLEVTSTEAVINLHSVFHAFLYWKQC